MLHAQSASEMEKFIADYAQSKKATIGVAASDGNDYKIGYNAYQKFPLLSVFKLHVALATLDKMNQLKTHPDSMLHIKASQLKTNTYSPLQKQFPNQDLSVSLKNLLEYCVSQSDNNACDILIDYVGGINAVDRYIRSLGLHDFRLSKTENDMHVDPMQQYANYSTPVELIQLLHLLDKKSLFKPIYHNLLWHAMVATQTGTDKLKGELPDNVTVGHKTGSSDRIKGIKIADNDAGITLLPNGKKYYMVVFVMNSYETDKENAAIIAHISKMVYDWYMNISKNYND